MKDTRHVRVGSESKFLVKINTILYFDTGFTGTR